jgi:hypothetical protein
MFVFSDKDVCSQCVTEWSNAARRVNLANCEFISERDRFQAFEGLRKGLR